MEILLQLPIVAEASMRHRRTLTTFMTKQIELRVATDGESRSHDDDGALSKQRTKAAWIEL
jgi:hypothetical protein